MRVRIQWVATSAVVAWVLPYKVMERHAQVFQE